MKTINTMPVLSFKITGIIVILLMWTSSFTQAKTNNSTDCFYVDRMSTTMSDKNDMKQKIIIYQVLTRLFGNPCINRIPDGSIVENGCGKMNYFTTKALKQIKSLGITHIWYTGLIEHATQTDYSRYGINKDNPIIVKGKAGSPYAIKDYYNIDPDLAEDVENRMEEFNNLLKRTHDVGLKLIIDFIPNHVSREYHSNSRPKGVKDLGEDDDNSVAFSNQNNYYYIPNTKLEGITNLHDVNQKPYIEFPAKATGNDRFDAYPNSSDWYETIKLNYGVDYLNNRTKHFDPIPNTWIKMRDILLFWAKKGVNGFRCDMAEMVPVEFWEWAIPQVKQEYPEVIFIAEIYNPGEYKNYIYRGQFDYLYDKVGLYDTLKSIICGYESASVISNRWQSLGGIEKKMLNFLENHDEQRIASDQFAGSPYKGFPAMIVSACMNTNPMMIYFGQELGERGMDNEGYSGRDGRTTIFDYWSVDSYWRWQIQGKYSDKKLSNEEKNTREFYSKLLNICKDEKAISNGEFFDLAYANKGSIKYNEHKQYSFLRKYDNELLLIVANFDSIPTRTEVSIPAHAFEYLKIPNNVEFKYQELISGTDGKLSMVPDGKVTIQLEPYSGKIIKIKL
jgi:glycosidase